MKVQPLFVSVAIILIASVAAFADKGKAILAGTQPGVEVQGVVDLEETPDGLKVDAKISKAPPGKHAFHIHEFGSCDNQGNAAGSHYNPGGHPHGNTLKDGVYKAHAGDFGNIKINRNGQGSLRAVVPGLTLSKGEYTAAGRAFVLHEKEDDFSQPTGNAGGRIACGPVLITGK